MFRKLLLFSLTCTAAFLYTMALQPADSFALLGLDFDQRYFHEPSWVIRDHAFFKQDSTYHLFYTRGPLYSQTSMACDSIGHATSRDLVHWNIYAPVLAVVKHTWEAGAVWAPFVMENPGGGYIMYYTGVDSTWVQRIGIATSDDLYTWTKYSGNPVFRPDTSWSGWDSTVEWASCRDPYVYDEDGVYYMLLTVMTNNGNGAVGSAVSADLFNWTDNGPIYVHSGLYSWHAIESVFLLKRNGKYRMFFSEETSPPGTSYMASDELYSGWDLATRQTVDEGIAPEIVEDGEGIQLFSRFARFMKEDTVNYAVKIDTLRWIDDVPGTQGPHPLAQYWETRSGVATLYQPTYMDNSFERGAAHSGYAGNSWAGTLEYFQGPLQNGWAGWSVGEDATGYMQSFPFTVEGDSISLLVGGGNKPESAYVALFRASDDSLLLKETGRDTDAMDRRVWHVKPYKGQSVYIKIVDGAVGTWGHINCDEIEEFYAPPDTLPPLVQVIHPNGGEVLFACLSTTINWSATDIGGVDSVSIYCSLDGGESFPFVLATGEPNDGEFLWSVPDMTSDNCVVKVVAFDSSLNEGSDSSDGPFSIDTFPEIPALSPLLVAVLAFVLAGAVLVHFLFASKMPR